MSGIKTYYCKLCKNKFGGNRKNVRKHIQEVHHIKGKQKNMDGKYLPSAITSNCYSE